MKKPLFIILAFIMMGTYAQNDNIFDNNSKGTQNGDYMQSAGSHSFEVSFNPSNIFATGGDAFSLINGTVKYRNFSTAQKALRIGLNVNFQNYTDIIQQADEDVNLKELKQYTTVYGITLMPGFEKHFDVSDRISPYVGAQAIISYKQTSEKTEYEDGDSIETIEYINSAGHAGDGYLAFGPGVFTGVDYYFVKRLYIGVEVGFAFQYYSMLSAKKIDSGDSDNNDEYKNGSQMYFGPGLTTGNIRLGWTF